MRLPFQSPFKLGLVVVVLGLVAATPALWRYSRRPASAFAADDKGNGRSAAASASAPATSVSTNRSNAVVSTAASSTSSVVTTGAPILPATNQLSITAAPTNPPAVSRSPVGEPASSSEPGKPDEIQLSFQGANVDMVVQWLAKTTGKSVVKHPRVQCQLNIVSSKKLTQRDAVNLVFGALALEGFNAIETSKSILLVPDGQEPKLSPEFVDASQPDVPEGRQRLIRVYPLNHIPPAEMKDKLRSVISEKAVIEASDRSKQIVVTDYSDNHRLIGDLIKELDVPSGSDMEIEFFSLKHSEAEELGALLNLVLNAQPAPPPSASRSSSSSMSSGGPPMPGGGSMPPGVSSSPPPSTSSSSPPSSSSGSQAAGQIRVWPDRVANRIIVAAPKARFTEIRKLVELLDTEKPQDVTVRLIPLKNASAEDLVKELGPLYQKMGGKSLKDIVEVAANVRANTLVVLSSESNFKTLEKLITSLDTDEAQEKVMRAFTLKNADAEDVAKQIKDLNQDQDSGSRYPFYIFSSSFSSGRAAKKINVVADRRRNTVIVQAPPAVIENVEKIILALDEPVTDDSLAPKIYHLKYVSASDIEDVLNELFLKRQQQRYYWDYYYGSPPEDTSDRQGRLFGKVRITSEPFSNTIIISGNSPESIAAVEEVLKELDVPSQAGDTTLRVGLKFAQAVDVANSINILFAKGGSPPLRQVNLPQQPGDARQNQQQSSASQSNFGLEQEQREDSYFPWLGGQPENNFRGYDGRSTVMPVSELVGRVRVVPDRRGNGLMVTCKLHFYPQVLKLINELDAPTPQVMIEAKIVEVSSDFRERLGVRWSPDGSRTFDPEDLDNAISVDTRTAYRNVFLGSAVQNSLHSGVLDAALNLDFLIQFLRKNTDSKVLAEPKLNIADNETGKLFVGSQVPFIDRTLSTDVGGLNQSFSYKDVGIILEVTPHINDDQEVALRIRAESSSIRSGETLFGGAILDTRNFRTELMVKSGETVVLGGIIQRAQQDTLRKTPLLGNIPGLGWLFKKKDNLSREVELMVFLRPRVVRSPQEAQELKNEVEKQTPMIHQWDEGVHQDRNSKQEQNQK